ncbi:3'-5' exonuclease [Dictyobacter formicarum]|uniref:Exonuclease n=1 Tax=Dictyobacter formicarum TaxID=2778368 RepID=A0ABQ3VDN2_9CHLR|nr:3'-5' exonuclease [Dictyobacter formicarum]GHO84252.1 exonuclease [Dictyobacter formicarum]
MVKRKLDKVLIVDVEATCWENGIPEGQENEIIEIGLCLLDVASWQSQDKRSIIVRPEHSTISPFCTQLTGITQEQVDQGISFSEACTLLKAEYGSQERVWASYGEADRLYFERQCQSRRIAYPFAPRHINIKALFALWHGLPKEVGMSTALHIAGLPLEGTHHHGDDDAWNIAALFSAMMKHGRNHAEH